MRSTIEPRIRQQVIAAKVAWKATYTSSYSGVFLLKVEPWSRRRLRIEGAVEEQPAKPPMKALPWVKASE